MGREGAEGSTADRRHGDADRSDAIGLGLRLPDTRYSYALRQASLTAGSRLLRRGSSKRRRRSTRCERRPAISIKGSRGSGQHRSAEQLAVAAWESTAVGRSTIAFTVDGAHAHALSDCFESAASAPRAEGETRKTIGASILRHSPKGRSTSSQLHGADGGHRLPRTSCILHAKTTKSATTLRTNDGPRAPDPSWQNRLPGYRLVDVARGIRCRRRRCCMGPAWSADEGRGSARLRTRSKRSAKSTPTSISTRC